GGDRLRPAAAVVHRTVGVEIDRLPEQRPGRRVIRIDLDCLAEERFGAFGTWVTTPFNELASFAVERVNFRRGRDFLRAVSSARGQLRADPPFAPVRDRVLKREGLAHPSSERVLPDRDSVAGAGQADG